MRTFAGLLGLAAVVLAIGVLGLATLPGHAAIEPSLAIDAATDGNDASQLGPLDYCRRVEVGDTFTVDATITDVTDLHEWEFYLGYDPTLITFTNYTAMMMANGAMADGSAPGPPHQYFLAFGGSAGASGSGVLARLTFQANEAGISELRIEKTPAWPRLSSESGPIGDTSGDGYFDGPMSNAQIAVGQDCPASPPPTTEPLPTMTAPPTPRITRSPEPSPTEPPPLTPTPTRSPKAETATPTAKPSPVTSPSIAVETESPSDPPTATSTTPPQTVPPPVLQGDVTCNGIVDVMDVLATLDEAAHIGVPTTCSDLADVNCDGEVDVRDALLILLDVTGDAQHKSPSCPDIGTSMTSNFSR